MTRGRIALVCAGAGLTMADGPLVFQAIEEIIAFHIVLLSTLIGPCRGGPDASGCAGRDVAGD